MNISLNTIEVVALLGSWAFFFLLGAGVTVAALWKLAVSSVKK